MEKKNNIINYAVTAALFLLFVIFTVIVKTVDVRPIGVQETSIGLASINKAVFDALGTSEKWYKTTEFLGYFAILVAVGFAVIGLVQAIQRKSIKKVDYRIMLLGGFYVAVIAFYLIFEILVVNYRPVLVEGKLEASYPSSHTMLTLCILTTAIMQIHYLIKNKLFVILLDALAIIVMAVTVIGRLLSGMHWFSDIVGGILLSTALIMLYYSAVKNCQYVIAKKSVADEEIHA